MAKHRGYQMQLDEVDSIIESCKRRGIHFDIIELTGGEASLWDHLEYGAARFAEICDMVTLATNGNNPERVKALGLKTWIVSASQATKAQMNQYKDVMDRITVNAHTHKRMPDVPLDGVLPATCATSVDPFGNQQIGIEYVMGKVYYCCDTLTHEQHAPITPDLVCDFEDDFINHFKDKRYDKEMCRHCLANGKVWSRL